MESNSNGGVLRHDVLVVEKSCPTSSKPAKTASGAASPSMPKNCRAAGIIQQNFTHDQIEEHANRRPFHNWTCRSCDPDSKSALQRCALPWSSPAPDEAVQFAVKLNLLQNFPPIRLEGGPKSCNSYRKLGHQPVRDAARHPAHQPVVSSLVAPPASQVVAFSIFSRSSEFLRVVLQIAVHRDDDFPARKIQIPLSGPRLPEFGAAAPRSPRPIVL